MRGERVCIDGILRPWDETGFDPDSLLARGYLYQRIHTLEHRPLHTAAHTELLRNSYRTLYGITPDLDEEMLRREIALTLRENRYPAVSNLVTLYLFPPHDGEAGPRMISGTKTLVYSGYTLWHSRLKAVTLPYDYPFPEHETALSRIAHTFATEYAHRTGADIPLTENREGVITGAGENPLFAVCDDSAVITPVTNGAAESVLRRLGIVLCREAGLTVQESDLTGDLLRRCDELFCLTPQGVVSLSEWDGRRGFNIAAEKIGILLERTARNYAFEFGIR